MDTKTIKWHTYENVWKIKKQNKNKSKKIDFWW